MSAIRTPVRKYTPGQLRDICEAIVAVIGPKAFTDWATALPDTSHFDVEAEAKLMEVTGRRTREGDREHLFELLDDRRSAELEARYEEWTAEPDLGGTA